MAACGSKVLALILGTCLATWSAVAQEASERLLMPDIPRFRTSAAMGVPDLVVRARVPEVPGVLPVFEILPVRPDDVQALSAAFGLGDSTRRTQRGRIVILGKAEDGAAAPKLTVFEASGGFHYESGSKPNGVEVKPSALPSDADALAAALNFLRERGLLPNDAVTDRSAVRFSSTQVSERSRGDGKVLQEYATETDVRFAQRWGDYPVAGPGSKLYLAFGDGGQVVSVTRMWREVRPSQSGVPSLPPEEALRTVSKGRANASFPEYCARAEIRQFDLVYWSESPSNTQRLGLPVYQIEGSCFTAGGEDLGEFQIYAPAAKAAPLMTRQLKTPTITDQDEER